MATDFYDGVTEDTDDRLKRMGEYVELALKNGDPVVQSKPYELTITIRKRKEAPNG